MWFRHLMFDVLRAALHCQKITVQVITSNRSAYSYFLYLQMSFSTWTTSSPCKASICLGLLCRSLLPWPSFPKSPSPQLNTSPVSVRAMEWPSDPQDVTSWTTTYPATDQRVSEAHLYKVTHRQHGSHRLLLKTIVSAVLLVSWFRRAWQILYLEKQR